MTPQQPPSRLPSRPCRSARTAALVARVGSTSPGLLMHGARVANLAAATGQRVGIAGARLEVLRRAALLHDVGKREVPRDVLGKRGPLLVAERRLIEEHPLTGAGLVRRAGLAAEARIVRHHHERWDGTGYPDKLARHAIPLESRIILVADAWDAMTSDRPYRAAIAPELAAEEIERSAGTQLDPIVAEVFLGVLALEHAA